jgi:octaprenyl-diphosphate synthase
MTKTIARIKNPLSRELKEYDLVFKEIMSSNIKLVDTVAKYIVKHKGKSLRPLLVLLSAKLVGTPNENTYRIAAIIEMLHSASLIHDDVVDEASVRRGFPSINAIWKNKVAVLIGDYLLSKCLIGATLTERLEVMNILSHSSKRLSKGELFQIEKSIRMNITEEEYINMVSDKTAALLSAAAELGALSTSDKEEDRNNLKDFGENLGIAFQIQDDLLDYYGHQRIIGKPAGNDFKEKKITLPLIHSFDKAQPKEIKKIKKMLSRGVTRKDISAIITFAEEYGGIDYAQLIKKKYAQKAKDCLNSYPDNDIRAALFSFVDYAIQRKH